jgi:hypothetical protein
MDNKELTLKALRSMIEAIENGDFVVEAMQIDRDSEIQADEDGFDVRKETGRHTLTVVTRRQNKPLTVNLEGMSPEDMYSRSDILKMMDADYGHRFVEG